MMGVAENAKDIWRLPDYDDDNNFAWKVDGFSANREMRWSVFPTLRQWVETILQLQQR